MSPDCPHCHENRRVSVPTGSDERPSDPCPHCGAPGWTSSPSGGMPNQGSSGEDRPALGETGLSRESVAAMSPAYPRYRNAVILVVFLGIVLVILMAIHLVAKGIQDRIAEFVENPIARFVSTVVGSDRYEVCREFLGRHEGRFAMLGSNLELVPMRQKVQIVNGTKTATVVATVTGTKASGNVTFRLKKMEERWQVRQAALAMKDGRSYQLYP